MKLKLWNIFLILTFFFGCQNDKNLNGNYTMCYDGEYAEIYFKKDSMRVASENEWVKLSEWRKIKIINDTLHFETFGEWREKSKAEINYIGINKIEIRNLETNEIRNLVSFNENLNFENQKEFWTGFNNRKNSRKCE